MNYPNTVAGTFVSRPNRFIARVMINGIEETVHVKNTGRCRELLREGATVYLAKADNPERKTKYDLIAVEKVSPDQTRLINMDSQIVNDVAEEWLKRGELFSPAATIRREVRYGTSRFDFYIEDGKRRAYLEVKGVTLERDGIASFPDAPTERGVKHLRELIACKEAGLEAYVLFIVQMKGIRHLCPNDETHPAFGATLRAAAEAGVSILAVDCIITPDSVTADQPILVVL